MTKKFLSVLGLGLLIGTSSLAVESKYERRVERAADNLSEMMTEYGSVPRAILQKAKCVASIRLYKAGLIYGGKVGKGVTSCRLHDGSWSAPSMSRLTGVSAGIQAGFAKVDLLMFIMDESTKENILNGNFEFDVNANLTLGRDELNAGVEFNKPIYTMVDSKGIFAGITLEGSYLNQVDSSNRNVYGPEYTAYEILTRSYIMPESLSSFTGLLNFYTN